MSEPARVPAEARAAAVMALRSDRVVRLFDTYLTGFLGRKFTAVRCLRNGNAALPEGKALVVFGNHPSWFDPLFFLTLANRFTPRRKGYGPMDAAALDKYRFMRRLGIFGLDQSSPRGAADFLAVSRGLLAEPANALWLTPQGSFTDVRTRPIAFKPGLAHIARDCDVTLVPVAMELTFWNEARPEALVAFGAPIEAAAARDRSTAAWNETLEAALAATMDELAEAAMARDPDRFDTVIAGRAGINPIYDGWRYLKALLRGQSFSAAHGGSDRDRRP